MSLNKYVTTFAFFLVFINFSCSKKGVLFPRDSVYDSDENTSYSYLDKTYPITLTDKTPFQTAVYRDATELSRLIGLIYVTYKQKFELKGYYIVSCDDKYIYYGYLSEKNGKYAMYNPIREDSQKANPELRMKDEKTLQKWVAQELNKGSTVSIAAGNKEGTFIVKSLGII